VRAGWHYDARTGRWESSPMDMTRVPMGQGHVRAAITVLQDTIEDIELAAAEMGTTRRVIHGVV
jgi:hypothetical protein